MRAGWGSWVAAIALVGALGGATDARATSQQDVEESLTCQCGCGLTVHSCNHLQCGSGEPMKAEIAERIAHGEDKDTIIAAFRTKYGEKVLSAPTFGGFNRLAWITPFAALILAGSVLAYRLARRSATATGAVAAGGTTAPTADPGGRSRIEQALAEFDRDA